jgi:opacity protein-like surface antigen
MRIVTLSISIAALALCLGAAQLPAQQPGNSAFQWYAGGHGGIMTFETPAEGTLTKPMGGAHLLVTARRTGLLLSVEQGFGSNEQSFYNLTVLDSLGNVISDEDISVTFNYVRKYSAMLMAFPIKGPLTPFFGIGVGVIHTGGHTPRDDPDAKNIGSSGFGTLVGGLNFRISRFSAFGQYQVTSGPSPQVIARPGPMKTTWISSGNLINGPTHTFSAGLRFGLGNARERATGGGY